MPEYLYPPAGESAVEAGLLALQVSQRSGGFLQSDQPSEPTCLLVKKARAAFGAVSGG